MGAGNSRQPPSFEAPHPSSAEGAQERLRTMLRFLRDMFVLYLGEDRNALARAADLRLLDENALAYLEVIRRDLAVFQRRFGTVPELLTNEFGALQGLSKRCIAKRDKASSRRTVAKSTGAGLAVGTGIVLAAPAALAAAGFTTAGVAAGSTAAAAQSYFYGAFTTGVFSTLQSVGAAGGLSATAGAGVTAATTAAGTGLGAWRTNKSGNEKDGSAQSGSGQDAKSNDNPAAGQVEQASPAPAEDENGTPVPVAVEVTREGGDDEDLELFSWEKSNK